MIAGFVRPIIAVLISEGPGSTGKGHERTLHIHPLHLAACLHGTAIDRAGGLQLAPPQRAGRVAIHDRLSVCGAVGGRLCDGICGSGCGNQNLLGKVPERLAAASRHRHFLLYPGIYLAWPLVDPPQPDTAVHPLVTGSGIDPDQRPPSPDVAQFRV